MMSMGRTLQRRLQGLVVLAAISLMVLVYHIPNVAKSSATSQSENRERSSLKVHGAERIVDGRKLSASVEFSKTVLSRNSGNGKLGVKNIVLEFVTSLPKANNQDSSIIKSRVHHRKLNNKTGLLVDPGVDVATINSDKSSFPRSVCDEECQRLRTLMQSWPPDRPRAAFYYLTRVSRMTMLNQSLASVDAHFNNHFTYPIIIFHETDLSPYLNNIRRMTKSPVFFQLIKFTIPEFLTMPIPTKIPCTSSVSYRHMCRFHSKVVYELPIMQTLQYYWRLDDDSLLLSNLTYDVFKHMEEHSIQYGFLWRHWDALSCVKELWEHTELYIKEHNITTQFFKSWTKAWLYYNNFEISSTKMWFSQEYKSYIEYIDRLGGMFYHRWGDAPIHGIAVSMFVPKNQTKLFHDIGYQHGWYKHQPNGDDINA